jgi:hypothetical protein
MQLLFVVVINTTLSYSGAHPIALLRPATLKRVVLSSRHHLTDCTT